jgi:hypothetical protein
VLGLRPRTGGRIAFRSARGRQARRALGTAHARRQGPGLSAYGPGGACNSRARLRPRTAGAHHHPLRHGRRPAVLARPALGVGHARRQDQGPSRRPTDGTSAQSCVVDDLLVVDAAERPVAGSPCASEP